MSSTFATVDEYIASLPENTQRMLQQARRVIHKVVPGAEEAISYGIPTFKIAGKYLVYFAGWQNHISIYPVPRGNASLQKKITPYVAGKGTLRFPLDKPIPYDLIQQIASQLLAEHLAR